MQERARPRLEELRTVAAIIVRPHVPGLPLEIAGIRRKHAGELGQPAEVAQPQIFFPFGVDRRWIARIGPQRIEIMIARDDRKRQRSVQDIEGPRPVGHFHIAQLIWVDIARHHRSTIGHALETALFMRRIHPHPQMLPDIAQMGRKHDITALAACVVRDITHLLIDKFAPLKREACRLLITEIRIVLRIRDHRDRELATLRCSQSDSGNKRSRGQPRSDECAHEFDRYHENPIPFLW